MTNYLSEIRDSQLLFTGILKLISYLGKLLKSWVLSVYSHPSLTYAPWNTVKKKTKLCQETAQVKRYLIDCRPFPNVSSI